ncbi:MAG: ATP-binding protein, partial [Lachnospiraceae bacterium]|nr:ATP-binding protein [Lachnospiraceae bacterium]
AFGATLIVGPKWCGKTTTAEEQAKSILKMQDPDMREGYLATANAKPSLLLKGENPRLIDEWQEAPVLWDAVRTAVDQRQEEGLFILTGSTSVDEKQIHHTGTGRISRLKMYTMSLFESGESNGRISLKELFDNQNMDIDGISSEMRIDDLIFAACRGGWPSSLRKKSDAAKLIVARDYLRNVYESDVSTVDGVRRNPTLAETVLKSYARNVSTLAKKSIIFKDIAANSESVSAPTLDSYLNALERLFVIEDIEAWCPAIRSATTIRAGKKRGFVDPSMAVAALGLTPEYLEKDLKTFGFIFECMCIRDLKIYSQALNGKVSYYHDRYDLEADAVLHIADGRYALIEFKLGNAEIDEGAKHLLKIRELVRAYNKAEKQVPLREPDLLMVITGGSMAYTREDGVKVIPIACLKD